MQAFDGAPELNSERAGPGDRRRRHGASDGNCGSESHWHGSLAVATVIRASESSPAARGRLPTVAAALRRPWVQGRGAALPTRNESAANSESPRWSASGPGLLTGWQPEAPGVTGMIRVRHAFLGYATP